MPFTIRQKGSSHQVVNADTGEVKGTHATKEKARRQLAALKTNVRESAPPGLSALLSPLAEVETFSKPGIADVTPSDLKKLDPLIRHYAGMVHPFTSCYRDQVKHGLAPEHAKRRCSVIKQLGPRREVEDAQAFLTEVAAITSPSYVAQVALREEAPAERKKLSRKETEVLEELEERIREAAMALEVLGEAVSVPTISQMRRASQRVRREARKPSSSPSSSDDRAHPRARAGTSTGGQFITKGSVGMFAPVIARKLGVKGQESFTRKDVRRYQQRNDLLVDGKIGAQTATSLLGVKPRAPGKLPGRLRKKLTASSGG